MLVANVIPCGEYFYQVSYNRDLSDIVDLLMLIWPRPFCVKFLGAWWHPGYLFTWNETCHVILLLTTFRELTGTCPCQEIQEQLVYMQVAAQLLFII